MTLLIPFSVQASLAALGTLAGILIFACGLLIRKNMAKPRAQVAAKPAEGTSMADLQAAIESISRDLASANERIDMVSAPSSSPRIGGTLDLTIRSRILRLRRFGQTPEQISSALHIPIGEVLLTLKIHNLAVQNATSGRNESTKTSEEARNLLPSFDM